MGEEETKIEGRLFPSPKSATGHITKPERLKSDPHMHRRTFATVAMEADVLEEIVGRLLVTGMTSRLRQMKTHPERVDPWARALLERKPTRLATVAMANKTARINWAVLTKNEHYRPHAA